MTTTQLIPVSDLPRHYGLTDAAPFIRGIERGRLRFEKRGDTYFTSVAWMEEARAAYGIHARAGR